MAHGFYKCEFENKATKKALKEMAVKERFEEVKEVQMAQANSKSFFAILKFYKDGRVLNCLV